MDKPQKTKDRPSTSLAPIYMHINLRYLFANFYPASHLFNAKAEILKIL